MKTVSVPEFLETVEVSKCAPLPLAHSTSAANLFEIAHTEKLRLSASENFEGEHLLYLFVGRPAFKMKFGGEASYWQCPAVFVVKDVSGTLVKRIHPFDTGAFINGLLPTYLTLFPLARFNLGTGCEIIGKLISSFFGDAESYMYGRGLGEQEFIRRFNLTARHQEIEALTRLYNDRPATFDDRGKCIEI